MGGIGSGRWDLYARRVTVEECLTLDVGRLVKGRRVFTGQPEVWSWSYGQGCEPTATVRIAAEPGIADDPCVRLTYSVADGDGQQPIEDVVPLEDTRPFFGGVRWWFYCMGFQRAGSPCGRRVGKLYLPPGGSYFRCRHCYNLTYHSCQASRENDSLLRKLSRETGYPMEAVKRFFAERYK